jgi:hypothetical protein
LRRNREVLGRKGGVKRERVLDFAKKSEDF